ncbi:hypothetical protein [Chryseobacterium sp. Hurlbut01]|uniref:hypothetical protein n=1 Tax=Chryseobacterium sp. Hurlbut01 TaxID=1681828 RepID=UPI00067D12C2|nr:hypothetical protein [Chryseobacterium sp. Hurlbut01]KNB60966.1 hypothetical protein AC804_17630 [Chryseobacterium sp. Hurlbut01]
MNDLNIKANGLKKVNPATDTKANGKSENSKLDAKALILDTTAEKRIKNLENFQKLCARHNYLKHKSDKLNSYLIGRDGLKETLTIECAEGEDFEISNTAIIGEILELCQNKLFDLLEKSEKEVLEFKI